MKFVLSPCLPQHVHEHSSVVIVNIMTCQACPGPWAKTNLSISWSKEQAAAGADHWRPGFPCMLHYLHPLSYSLTTILLYLWMDLLPLKMIEKTTFAEGVCPLIGLGCSMTARDIQKSSFKGIFRLSRWLNLHRYIGDNTRHLLKKELWRLVLYSLSNGQKKIRIEWPWCVCMQNFCTSLGIRTRPRGESRGHLPLHHGFNSSSLWKKKKYDDCAK